jgi:hypothetical protein
MRRAVLWLLGGGAGADDSRAQAFPVLAPKPQALVALVLGHDPDDKSCDKSRRATAEVGLRC